MNWKKDKFEGSLIGLLRKGRSKGSKDEAEFGTNRSVLELERRQIESRAFRGIVNLRRSQIGVYSFRA